MADEFDFAALAKNWQQQLTPVDIAPSAADLTQASQRQRRQWLLMVGEWLGAVVMAVTASWILFELPGWLGWVSAAVLVLGALSTVYISWQVHRPILRYNNWSSSGIVQFHYRVCHLTLRYYRFTQFSCVMLLLFSAALWLLHWWQPAEVSTNLLLFYTLIVSPLCLLAIYRLQKKIGEKTTDLHRLSTLADEFQCNT